MIRISRSKVCGAVLLLAAFSGHADTQATGKQLYERCAACHLPTGEGVPGMFPPLRQRLDVFTGAQGGRDYLVMVVHAGLAGGIQVDGVPYQGMMPPQGEGLGNAGIAAVLNYVLTFFNGESLSKDWRRFTDVEVAEIKSRYPDTNVHTARALRQSALPDTP